MFVVPAVATTATATFPPARSAWISRFEPGGLHPVARVRGHHPDAGRAEAEHLRGLGDAAVAFGAGVQHEAARQAGQPVPAVVGARPGRGAVPGHGERGQRGGGAAADQLPRVPGGPAEQPGEPPDHLVLQVHGGVVTARHAGVHGCGECLGQHPERVRGRVDPGRESGMPVPERVRGDVRCELGEHRVGGLALLGPFLRPHGLDQGAGRRPVRRTVGQAGQVAGDQVGHLVGDLADLRRVPERGRPGVRDAVRRGIRERFARAR